MSGMFNKSMLGIAINTITGDVIVNKDYNNSNKSNKSNAQSTRFNGEQETRTAEQRCLLRWSR